MHWNVPPDALPGSATLVRVLDRWLNDCVRAEQSENVAIEGAREQLLAMRGVASVTASICACAQYYLAQAGCCLCMNYTSHVL